MAAVKSALVGNSDNAMPAVVINTIKWADGNKLNAVTTKVNGVKYGKDGTTINVSDIATVASTPYTKNSKGAYVVADDINDELYIKVSFNPNTVLVGDYVVALDFYKSGSNNVTVATTANLSVTAPENTIVKNAPYFNGDNAVVYGTANGTQVTADLDDLFTTEGLAYTVTKIKEDADAEEAEYSPWLGANGAITVPVAATGNANYCVGRDCKLKCVK